MLWYTKLGGRKFIIAMVSLLGSLAGLYAGVLPAVQLVVILLGILGLYGYNNNKHKEIETTNTFMDDK